MAPGRGDTLPPLIASVAVGVGHILTASFIVLCFRAPLGRVRARGFFDGPRLPQFASGVGNNKNSVPDMRGTKGGSRYAMPFRVITDRGQRPEYSTHPPSKQRCHVLQHNDAGSELSNHANGFKEQSASLSIKSCPKSGVGNVLTWKPAADDVNGFEIVRADLRDVSLSVDVRPVLLQHLRRVVVDFNLPLALHSCSFESKVKPSYAGEQ
jgi:hypothetical protein